MPLWSLFHGPRLTQNHRRGTQPLLPSSWLPTCAQSDGDPPAADPCGRSLSAESGCLVLMSHPACSEWNPHLSQLSGQSGTGLRPLPPLWMVGVPLTALNPSIALASGPCGTLSLCVTRIGSPVLQHCRGGGCFYFELLVCHHRVISTRNP